MKKLLNRFRKDTDGSVTLETLMWIPVYFVLSGLVVDATSIALTQARMQAAVSDAARLVAVGYYTNEQGVAFIQNQAYSIETFTARISTADNIVTATVSMPLADVIGLKIIARGEGVFGASAHFYTES